MQKIKYTILLLLIIPLLLSACSKPPEIPQTNKIISTLCDKEINLPAGKIYSSDFDKSEKNYLSDRLISSYFSEPDIEKYKKDWVSYSIFIPSSAHACEFAAIYCATPQSLIDTSRMLASRIDYAKKLYGDKFFEYTDNARVVNIGSYAVLIISNDTKAAMKAIRGVC